MALNYLLVKYKIGLARALYFKPDILILDEPTSGLDKNNEQNIFNTILKLSEEIIVIMTTHRILVQIIKKSK